MRIIGLTILASACLTAAAQDHKANLDQATAAYLRPLQSGQNQAIRLHTDKAHYKLGATIFFRVYLFHAISMKPLTSARVHLDLYDQQDSLVSSVLLNSASHEMDGGLKTSSRWKPGTYIIRVYTAEMAGSPQVGPPYEQSVFLFGNADDVAPQALAPAYRPGIGFYPEGGSLINGLDNTIAFRAINEAGEPMQVSGYLKDDQGKVVETFKTTVPGFGKFSFMPSTHRRYQGVIIMPDKTERSFPLDPSTPGAWQLSLVRTQGRNLVFRVAQGDSLYPLKPTSYVAAISRGRVAFAGIGKGVYEISIPMDSLRKGSSDILLFNDAQQLVSRRQVTLHDGGAVLAVNPDKTSFASRELVQLELDLKDAGGQPMSGIFSISVTDDRYTGPGMPVLRDPWMDITDPLVATPAMYEPVTDSAMWIRGVARKGDGSAAPGFVANLMSTEFNLVLTDTTTDSGAFGYHVPEFYEGRSFGVQVTDAKGAIVPVTLEPELQYHRWPAGIRRWVADTTALTAAYRRADADSFMTGQTMMAIRNANAQGQGGKGKKQAQADVANRNSRMITAEQLNRLGLGNTAQAVMMLPGIVMVNNKITIRGGTPGIDGSSGNLEPLVVTDGVPATNSGVAEYLNSLSPQNIESIEVMTGPEAAQFGTRGINGVILVKTSKNLRELPFDPKSGLRYITPQGYHKAPEFYIPPYGEPSVRYLSFMDNRSTIYWNGELLTDKNGKARVSFYAADQPATYTIHVKGISAKGDLLDKTITIGKK